jgi:hypothetical protein
MMAQPAGFKYCNVCSTKFEDYLDVSMIILSIAYLKLTFSLPIAILRRLKSENYVNNLEINIL